MAKPYTAEAWEAEALRNFLPGSAQGVAGGQDYRGGAR